MARKPSVDLAAVDLSWQLSGFTDREEYLQSAEAVLLALFDCDLVGWHGVDARRGEAEARVYPEPENVAQLELLRLMGAERQLSVLTARDHAIRLQPMLALRDRTGTPAGRPSDAPVKRSTAWASPLARPVVGAQQTGRPLSG